MTPVLWPCPLGDDADGAEYALSFDRNRAARLLIVPALFDEANKLRRLTVEVMRRLDGAGIDCFLPDLPGTNESSRALARVSVADWRAAMVAASEHFAATHVLGVRGGACLVPDGLPGWLYAPTRGANELKQMLRARVLAAREAGREEDRAELLERGKREGVDLAGFRLSSAMVSGLEELVAREDDALRAIEHGELGAGGGLWLRAEPDHDAAQADALAAIIAMVLTT